MPNFECVSLCLPVYSKFLIFFFLPSPAIVYISESTRYHKHLAAKMLIFIYLYIKRCRRQMLLNATSAYGKIINSLSLNEDDETHITENPQ